MRPKNIEKLVAISGSLVSIILTYEGPLCSLSGEGGAERKGRGGESLREQLLRRNPRIGCNKTIKDDRRDDQADDILN